jgi:hypothetical protein
VNDISHLIQETNDFRQRDPLYIYA